MKWVVGAGFLLCFVNNIYGGVLKKSDLLPGNECLPGTHWESQCNQCFCSDDGKPSCTEKLCVGHENDRELRCLPDTIWKKECNTCWCTSIGHAMCTRIGCNGLGVTNFNPTGVETVKEGEVDDEENSSVPNSSLIRKARATSQVNSKSEHKEPPKNCQPGQEFRMDCNKCLCDNEGQNFSCTRIDCAALNNNNNGGVRRKREVTTQVTIECTPGSVFQQGCKVCRCAQDGRQAICPTNCQNDKHHSQNDISNADSDPSFRCNPGEQFKRSCNDCTCSADGRSFFCTLRLCEEEIKDLAPVL